MARDPEFAKRICLNLLDRSKKVARGCKRLELTEAILTITLKNAGPKVN